VKRALFLSIVVLAGIACENGSQDKARVDSPDLPSERDAKLVGTWSLTSGGKATMTLRDDGTSRIETEANTPGGVVKGDASGTWSSEGAKLLMRRKAPDGVEFTVEYEFALKGSILKLTGKRGKPQTYQKSKA